MESSDKYTPIDCGVHDRLLDRATRRQPTAVVYVDGAGEELTAVGVIEDVFSRRGEEFLRLDGGEQIRLDRIVRFHDAGGG